MAGRPRKPTNVHYLTGSAKKHPDRMRERENEPEDRREIGDPPNWLNDRERDAYAYLVEKSIPGVLKECDEPAVAAAAKLLIIIWSDEAKVTHYAQFNKLLSQFGMTPADRSKIKIDPKGKKNKFDED